MYNTLEDGRRILEMGIYTPPREIQIGSIPAVVVDPHNEVLGYWEKFCAGKITSLLHVDHHEDMSSGSTDPVLLRNNGEFSDLSTYARDHVFMGGFIAVAVHLGMLKSVYCYDPREDTVVFYDSRHLKTRIVDGKIKWEIPPHGSISRVAADPLSINYAVGQMNQNEESVLLDIDLDAFAATTDPEYLYASIGDNTSQQAIDSNLRKTIDLLGSIKKPLGISVARSQTPLTYTPADLVDDIEKKVIRKLCTLYT